MEPDKLEMVVKVISNPLFLTVGLSSVFMGANLLMYRSTKHHYEELEKRRGMFYTKKDAKTGLEALENSGWLMKNVFCAGERLAHKRYLKENI